MSCRAVLAAIVAVVALAAPARANVGEAFEQAKARVRARGDVAIAEFWLEGATGEVVRERWRAAREAGWSYAEAKAICSGILQGRRAVSGLHLGLGWANGGALYYDAMPELDADGEPHYPGLVRADLEYGAPGRVIALNVQGPRYNGILAYEDGYVVVRHLVAQNEDQR